MNNKEPLTRPLKMNKRTWAKFQIARLSGREIVNPPKLLMPLLEALVKKYPEKDITQIVYAYKTAEKLHGKQFRKSGDPYITHPVAVATILANLGSCDETLIAALLHDTIEDTNYTLEEMINNFGETVAHLVDGVTKLDKLSYGEAVQSETVRKMIIAMSKDIRVLFIKLADRVHNARTWTFMPHQKAICKAKETLEIFAPLAHRLGINSIKWELEELSFKTIYPKVYDEIVRMTQERSPKRERFLKNVKNTITKDLENLGIKAKISARNKHYYSIYQKMIGRGKEFDEIYDLTGIRILVDTVKDCYATLGVIHAQWSPIHGRFKDYIAMPKFNMYKSLHTTVVGSTGKPFEVQIRTYKMHEQAEYGLAAHWKYKTNEKSLINSFQNSKNDMWLKSLVDWQNETLDPKEFLDSLRHEINSNEVYVYTPAGEIRALPSGSTPVDFAYSIHTDIGHKTIGAHINGKIMPLSTVLNNGDSVHIIVSKQKNVGPRYDWLDFIKSVRAKNKIKQWFTKERREENIENGKSELIKYMRKKNLPFYRLISHESMSTFVQESKYSNVENVYYALGSGELQPSTIVNKLLSFHGGEEGASEDISEAITPFTKNKSTNLETGVNIRGFLGMASKIAQCCRPVPKDLIVGFVTRGKGVSVHRKDCKNVNSLMNNKERIIDVSWNNNNKYSYHVEVQVEALDRSGLLSDIAKNLTENHVSILSAQIKTSDDRFAIFNFVFEMADSCYLINVLSSIRQIDGVFDAYRKNG